MEQLAKLCGALEQFSLKANPIAAQKAYRANVCAILKSITLLDGCLVEDLERRMLVPDDMGSLISNKSLDQDWESNLEVLNLSHHRIQQITSITKFTSLR